MAANPITNAGRHSKLNDNLIAKAEAYLATCQEKIETTDKGQLAWVDVKLPSIAGLALACDVGKSTLYEWELGRFYEGHEPSEEERALLSRFSVVITRVRLEQEERLVNGTAGKKYEPRIAALVLATHHGYSDKADVTSGGEPIKVTVVNYGTKNDNPAA